MSENTQNLVSNQDILQAIQSMEHRFGGLDHKFEGLDSKFDGLDHKLGDHIEESKKTHEDILSAINTSFTEIEDRMVSKDDLKQEFANMVTKDDLKKELAKFATKEDLKLRTCVK